MEISVVDGDIRVSNSPDGNSYPSFMGYTRYFVDSESNTWELKIIDSEFSLRVQNCRSSGLVEDGSDVTCFDGRTR